MPSPRPMDRLASRERVRVATVHEVLDRVPVMCQLALGHDFLFSGFDPVEYGHSATFRKWGTTGGSLVDRGMGNG